MARPRPCVHIFLQLTFSFRFFRTEVPQNRQRQQRAPVEQDAFVSSGESSDAYEQERPSKPKRKAKRRTDDGDARQAQKKRKRKQLTEEDLNDLPPEKGRFSSSYPKEPTGRAAYKLLPSE
jgi:hypothetical protein